MKLLSGPSEAQRTKKGSFTQSHRPIVVTGRQSAAGPQFVPQDPERDLDRRTQAPTPEEVLPQTALDHFVEGNTSRTEKKAAGSETLAV